MRWFRDFIVGNNASLIASEAGLKKVVLQGNLALVGLGAGVSYIFIDHYNGVYGNEPYYAACIFFSLVTLFLIRLGKYTLSAVFFLSAMALLIFVFSASDTIHTGTYVYFIASTLTAFLLFGYQKRWLVLCYGVISISLFCLAYWMDHPSFPQRNFSPEYIKVSYTINFIVSLVTCMAIVYFFLDVNYHSEKQILAKNEQLAKANAELDRFVYSASHDMRAPLSSILGLVQVYELTTSEEERDKVVELIRNRANKLDEFIREILDYSRNSRLDITPVAINPVQLVRDIVEGLRYSSAIDKIKIEISPTDDIMVFTDTERMKVILNNILGNAVKYYDPYKTHPFIKIIVEKKDVRWSIKIEDNGTGIAPEHQSKIFEMFYRGNDTSEGSGLGLYIAREAAQRLNGTIAVQSVHGQGSVFRIELPDLVVATA